LVLHHHNLYFAKYILLNILSIKYNTSEMSNAMELDVPWYELMRSGKKTFEGRLNSASRQHWNRGTVVTVNSKTGGQSFTVEITSRFDYPAMNPNIVNFGQVWEIFGQELLPGVNTLAEANNIYGRFWTAEEIREKGIVVFGVRVCDDANH